ncbi:hypothetical protein SL054_002496 [Flavobacterium psychrophilum]|uniref:hypothetical protein n=1 Tax=Flavobacterium psychrophilum TaxID=96345 RepID=UPI000B7C50C8|nr:hypothetical protein [Flavobacterium psychrophilum]ELY1993126.1 hypothetical protein [Flavobacterium psychrophilum]SNB12195.1 conserved hypothetical protein [Flavobacterium psychrophilum]SNB29073.1 conserved hypothetical protein [Flavobacterium psychrophilum]
MSKKKIRNEFLKKIEWFYRNFGNEWCIDDFTNKENEKLIIREFLLELNAKKIIKLLDENNFLIIDLPSNHINL